MNETEFELVKTFRNDELDLTAIIAVHNTKLGPSLGGCRLRKYSSLDEAKFDVLRLAEGMTYKSALAGLPLGGGKSVILETETVLKNRNEALKVFGKWVDSLNGKYIVAEDMGTSVDDVKIIATQTKYVSGSDPNKGGGGDPSPYTAQGVFLSIKECLKRVYGDSSLEGRKVVIQGVGHVGFFLGNLLAAEKADVSIVDVNAYNIKKAHNSFPCEILNPGDEYDQACDVFAPCAIGGILNKVNIGKLRCKIVAGAANNQLLTEEDEFLLNDKNILYAPDFVINSGGVIMCADELDEGGFNKTRVHQRVNVIPHTLDKVFNEAKHSGLLAGKAAVKLAREMVA